MIRVAIQPGWLGVRELGSGAGGGRGEGVVPDLLRAWPGVSCWSRIAGL